MKCPGFQDDYQRISHAKTRMTQHGGSRFWDDKLPSKKGTRWLLTGLGPSLAHGTVVGGVETCILGGR